MTHVDPDRLTFAKRKAKEAAEQAAKAKESTAAASKESEKDKMRWEAVSTATICVTGLEATGLSPVCQCLSPVCPVCNCTQTVLRLLL